MFRRPTGHQTQKKRCHLKEKETVRVSSWRKVVVLTEILYLTENQQSSGTLPKRERP